MSVKNIPDEVWQVARAVWENTPDISYEDLLNQLKDLFGDKAPTSKSTLANRIKKENWVKASLVREPVKMSEARLDKITSNIEQKTTKHEKQDDQNNKDKSGQNLEVYRTINAEIDATKENVVMSVKERSKIILKHRRRLHNAGVLEDAILAMSIDVANSVLNPELNSVSVEPTESGDDFQFYEGEEESPISRKLNVIKSLSNVLTNVTTAQKVIAEQEMPMCGITPDDFQQSEQDRRLGLLKSLEGIDEEERIARARLQKELLERMQVITQLEHDPDFFGGDDNIEDIEVDDDY